MNINLIAKEVFDIESQEIARLSELLTDDFENSINSILNSKGKFIISGMGKSGIVGKKIAATLTSTGTPSFFLHPGNEIDTSYPILCSRLSECFQFKSKANETG